MGGSSSGGASKSSGSQRNRPTKEAQQLQSAVAVGGVPNILEGSRQIFEALNTGGVGARLPIAQRGVEATNAATSQTVEGARENFARAGINAQDPFALEALGNLELQGATQAANIPVDQALQLQQAALSILGGTTPTAAGAQRGFGTQESKSAEGSSSGGSGGSKSSS